MCVPCGAQYTDTVVIAASEPGALLSSDLLPLLCVHYSPIECPMSQAKARVCCASRRVARTPTPTRPPSSMRVRSPYPYLIDRLTGSAFCSSQHHLARAAGGLRRPGESNQTLHRAVLLLPTSLPSTECMRFVCDIAANHDRGQIVRHLGHRALRCVPCFFPCLLALSAMPPRLRAPDSRCLCCVLCCRRQHCDPIGVSAVGPQPGGHQCAFGGRRRPHHFRHRRGTHKVGIRYLLCPIHDAPRPFLMVLVAMLQRECEVELQPARGHFGLAGNHHLWRYASFRFSLGPACPPHAAYSSLVACCAHCCWCVCDRRYHHDQR